MTQFTAVECLALKILRIWKNRYDNLELKVKSSSLSHPRPPSLRTWLDPFSEPGSVLQFKFVQQTRRRRKKTKFLGEPRSQLPAHPGLYRLPHLVASKTDIWWVWTKEAGTNEIINYVCTNSSELNNDNFQHVVTVWQNFVLGYLRRLDQGKVAM